MPLFGIGLLELVGEKAMVIYKKTLWDNGGRRLGKDRRIFSYSEYSPERRSGKDRRSAIDRRIKLR